MECAPIPREVEMRNCGVGFAPIYDIRERTVASTKRTSMEILASARRGIDEVSLLDQSPLGGLSGAVGRSINELARLQLAALVQTDHARKDHALHVGKIMGKPHA